MHVRLAGKAVLKAAQERAIPLQVTAGGLTLRVRWMKRFVTVNGRRSNLTGLGRTGLAVRITSVLDGTSVDVRTRVPHGWADEEVIERVAVAMGRAKALLKLEKRKIKRRRVKWQGSRI